MLLKKDGCGAWVRAEFGEDEERWSDAREGFYGAADFHFQGIVRGV